VREPLPYNPEVSRDIKSLSKCFGIPQYILRQWQLEGIISRSAVSAAEWEFLDGIRSGVWQNRNVIRAILRALPISERRRIIETCEKSAIERIVYDDFLRFKLRGGGIMEDGRPVIFDRYEQYLSWRHPNLCELLTRSIFEKQRKAALAKISYARRTGTLNQLTHDLFKRVCPSEP
jgi:hypothetical protein